MWSLPGPRIEPVSPALAGELLSTMPPGKSCFYVLQLFLWLHFEFSFRQIDPLFYSYKEHARVPFIMEKRLNNLKIFQPKGTGQEDGNFDWLRDSRCWISNRNKGLGAPKPWFDCVYQSGSVRLWQSNKQSPGLSGLTQFYVSIVKYVFWRSTGPLFSIAT